MRPEILEYLDASHVQPLHGELWRRLSRGSENPRHSCDQVHVWLLQLVKLYCACSRTRRRYSVLSAWLINCGIIFFSHNKSALTSLSAAETIGRTAPLNICSFVHCDSLACLIALDQEIGNKATSIGSFCASNGWIGWSLHPPVSSIAHPFCFSCCVIIFDLRTVVPLHEKSNITYILLPSRKTFNSNTVSRFIF
jgi:hypothetical protein